jgi:hypothetical protein
MSRILIVDDNFVPEYRIDETPTSIAWNFHPVYKYSSTGNQLIWQVGFDGVNHLVMSHGYVGGAIVTNKTEVKLNSSGKSMQAQALQEARQRYKLKYNEGYRYGIYYQPLVSSTNCMLADKYQENFIKWPNTVFVQPKLDGIRMLVENNGNVTMRSRANNYWTHMIHLVPELTEFFMYLPGGCGLDGEMYDHNLSFENLTSIIKSVVNIHPKLSTIKYHIFDINFEDSNGTSYDKRFTVLVNAYNKYVEDKGVQPNTFTIVPCETATSHIEILQKHDQYVAEGYEGIMIKKILTPTTKYNETIYKNGRCRNILKHKNFIDEEAKVIGVVDSEGTEKGAAMLIVTDNLNVTFSLRMRGSVERRRFWFQNPQTIIGKHVTFRYQERTENNVPRFPRGICVRDYE